MTDVRPATRDDLPKIALVAEAGWRHAYQGLLSPEEIDDALAQWYSPEAMARRLERGGLDVAASNEQLVGFIQHGPTGDGAYEVYALYVRPDHIGSGVGWALWRRANTAAAERGAHEIELWVLDGNQIGLAWYDRQGGVQVGQRSIAMRHGEHRELRYRFSVAP